MPTKRPLTRLRDIAENIGLIFAYTQEIDAQAFFTTTLVRDAVERCLMRISEAAVKLGPLAEQQFPSHDWRGIRNLGNILRHEYDGVVQDAVWAIVEHRLRPLLNDVEDFLSRFPEDQEEIL